MALCSLVLHGWGFHCGVCSAQYITVRNERGKEMLDSVRPRLVTTPTSSSGNRRPFVMATVESDDE